MSAYGTKPTSPPPIIVPVLRDKQTHSGHRSPPAPFIATIVRVSVIVQRDESRQLVRLGSVEKAIVLQTTVPRQGLRFTGDVWILAEAIRPNQHKGAGYQFCTNENGAVGED
jgi:hypothetical protein